MIKWIEIVGLMNSEYRDDHYSKVTVDTLLLMVEERNITDLIANKVEHYLQNNIPLDALIKACSDFNITTNHE